MISEGDFSSLTFGERLDLFSRSILLGGLRRPAWFYLWHLCLWAANYGGFLALALLLPRPAATPPGAHGRLLFAKFLVWQHLAEALGCRQGPLGFHFGPPNNWRFRLSLGTLKYAPIRALGERRNLADLAAHSLFFALCLRILASQEYPLACLRALCACDAWIFCSDMTQFYASTGHGYLTMLLAASFPVAEGQLAGMQLALIFQWFFSGVGKAGPWFGYVNGPFVLQSRAFAGRRWLFRLLVKSPEDLSPTAAGVWLARLAAAVEYVAPIALVCPQDAVIWAGLISIVAMHVYILAMPAPFDVYSWNTAYACCGVYLFACGGAFGLDRRGLGAMSPWLALALLGEFALCWFGQFFPDRVGYYLSHRYWAGNWVQTMFLVRNTPAAKAKLERVRTFSRHPVDPPSGEAAEGPGGRQLKHLINLGLYSSMAYLWLGNFNMKCFVRLLDDALNLVGGGAKIDDYKFIPLTAYCCGEFRDPLYTEPLLPVMQREMGFDEGECFLVRLGSFGMFREAASWWIYDMQKGVVSSGEMTRAGLAQMHAFPSQSLDRGLALAPGRESSKREPLLGAAGKL